MFHAQSPVGILDSGIGGFSVVRQVRQLLPGEDLLYFGDGAHVPYGNHDRQTIVAMSRYMFAFMARHEVKALLVACNTISCVMEECRDLVDCPVFSAVQAGADAVVELGAQRVGVISTVYTHAARSYPQYIHASSPRELAVFSRGCPNLARLVEENLGDPAGMALVEADLRRELDEMVYRDKIQCCVLGCTHYPLVEESIHKLYPHLTLIDPAQGMARHLRDDLAARGLLREGEGPGRLDIYTTGDVEQYALRAAQAGLGPVSSVSCYPPMEVG